MIEAGIHDGDMAVLKKTQSVRENQIVAVSINGDTTLKRYCVVDGRTVFMPANRSMDPIELNEGDEVMILGVLAGFFHYTP